MPVRIRILGVLPLFLWLLGCGPTSAEADKPVLNPAFIHDSQGRTVILRGLNTMSSAKGDPLRMPDMTAHDVQRMRQDWGFNFVRFLIFWDAIAPVQGQIDQPYLDRVEKWLDIFAQFDMYVLLDMHQDVYAQKFCCDGAPAWAIRDDGQPFSQQGTWSFNYFQPAVQHAFDHFWTDADLRDAYTDAWLAVVKRFAKHPAVIGYDLINEPSAGSMIDVAELLGTPSADSQSPLFDQTRLQPFQQHVLNAIRTLDTEHWIFVEPRYGAPAAGLPSWMPQFTDPRPGEPRIVLAPHLYSVQVEASHAYNQATDLTVPNWKTERQKELAMQGGALVVGEWGFDDGIAHAEQYRADILDTADALLAGWAMWSYDSGTWGIVNGDVARTERASAHQIVRGYAQKVAGTPTAMAWNMDARTLHLEWQPVAHVTGATEVYIPAKRFYPSGWTLQVNRPQTDWAMSWDATREVASITVTAAPGTTVKLDVVPK